VEIVIGVHRDPVGGRKRAVGRPPLHEAADPTATAATDSTTGLTQAERGERRLPHGPEAQHVTAQAARHREHRRDYRTTGTGELATAVDPRRMQPQRVLDRGGAPLAHPHARGTRIGRQPVDVVERQPGILHGCEAGIDRERERVDQQPAPDRRTADTGEHRTVFEAVARRRGARRRPLRLTDEIDGVVVLARRLEQGQPYVVMLFEADRHLLADVDLVRLATDDVRREMHARVFVERDVGDRVRRRERRRPLVLVDGERHDGGAA
jgi:hypothetical protein